MDIEKIFFDLMKEQGHETIVLLYPSQEVVNDPYENTTDKVLSNPIPIKAVVNSLSPEALRWKFFGLLPGGSKQLICHKRYKNLFKVADKIKIGEDFFKTYKDDSKGWGILDREAYIVVILQAKNDNS
jgi:hypothetical protein